MKRQSTVQKLSRTTLKALIAFCRKYNCGIIVRIGGIEYGYTIENFQLLLDLWTWRAGHNYPYIRKGWNSLSAFGQYNLGTVERTIGSDVVCEFNGIGTRQYTAHQWNNLDLVPLVIL